MIGVIFFFGFCSLSAIYIGLHGYHNASKKIDIAKDILDELREEE